MMKPIKNVYQILNDKLTEALAGQNEIKVNIYFPSSKKFFPMDLVKLSPGLIRISNFSIPQKRHGQDYCVDISTDTRELATFHFIEYGTVTDDSFSKAEEHIGLANKILSQRELAGRILNRMKGFCPDCRIGLNQIEQQMKVCVNCRANWNED